MSVLHIDKANFDIEKIFGKLGKDNAASATSLRKVTKHEMEKNIGLQIVQRSDKYKQKWANKKEKLKEQLDQDFSNSTPFKPNMKKS